MKTFEEYLLEASLRDATVKELNTAIQALKKLGNSRLRDINDNTVQVDSRTGDIYFTSTSGVRFVWHAKTNHLQELYAIAKAA